MLISNRCLILAWAILFNVSFGAVDAVFALPQTKVLSMEYYVQDQHEIITISLSNRPEYSTMTLINPDRIVIDLKNSFIPETHLVKEISGNIIKSCRISQNTKDKTRVVLDTKGKAEFDIVSSQSASYAQNDLRILVIPLSPKQNGTLEEKLTPQSSQKLQSLESESATPKSSQTVIIASDMPDAVFTTLSSDDNLPWTAEGKNENKPSFSISGSLFTRLHTDTVHNKPSENNSNEQTLGMVNKVIMSTDYNDIFKLSAKSDYRYAGDQNNYESYDFDLYETYIKYSGDPISVKIGKQIRRWGKADQFSPVDTLNPEDIREFITMEYEDRKVPVWMADASLKLGNFTIESVYIPIFEPTHIDYFGTDWAFYSHIKEDVWDNLAMPTSLKNYFQQMDINETEPNDSGLNGEYALRIATTLNGWDIGATYHYTWDDQPFFSSFPVKNFKLSGGLTENELISALDNAIFTQEMVEAKYIRSNIAGVEFETIISDFGVRGEAAWHDSQPFITSNLVSTEKPVFYSIIGADYTGKSNWYLNLQLSYSHISDYEEDILYFNQDTVALLGELSKEFFSSWFKTALHYHIALNENQFYLSPRIEYSYITNLDIIFGVHIFEGNPYTLLGRFNDNDQLFLDMEYHF